MKYQPAPLDTSKIEFGTEIVDIVESLARNTHEVWATQRLRDGWKYGPERDDNYKHHPCLVPYDELPEEEKEYDRVIVRQVIAGVFALGFNIEKKNENK